MFLALIIWPLRFYKCLNKIFQYSEVQELPMSPKKVQAPQSRLLYFNLLSLKFFSMLHIVPFQVNREKQKIKKLMGKRLHVWHCLHLLLILRAIYAWMALARMILWEGKVHIGFFGPVVAMAASLFSMALWSHGAFISTPDVTMAIFNYCFSDSDEEGVNFFNSRLLGKFWSLTVKILDFLERK